MRFYYIKDDNKKEIAKIDRDQICKDIDTKTTLWSKDLEEVRADYKRVLKEVYPSTNINKDVVKLIPDVYEQRQSLKANLFKSTYQNYDGCFDIEGLDEHSHAVSSLLKSALVYDCYKIDLQTTLDQVLDDYIDKGECAWFSHWDVKVERKRKQIEVPVLDNDGNVIDIEIQNTLEDYPVYSGADIKRIDPLQFFFDKSMKRKWNACGKIIRDFVPLSYVLTNIDYKLTPQERKELKEMVTKAQASYTDNITKDTHNIATKVIGSTVEVVEYYGDYIIPTTGDVARNVVIVVIAGKFLAKIDESYYPNCPIGYFSFNERPDTLRGQTPLKPALLLNELENACMDLTMEAWRLSVNPPMLAPKGAFQSRITYRDGVPIEYDYDNLSDAPAPRPISDFSGGMRGFEFQPFFKQKMEGATGISPYMQGTGGQGGVRTASESTYIYSGQTTRLSREAYLFSHNVIVPMIKALFDLKKEYEEADQLVPYTENGISKFELVTDEIRKGNYIFMIGNAQTSVEREQYVQRILQLLGSPVFQTITQRPEFPAVEFFKWIMNEVNFRQTDTLVGSMGLYDAMRQAGEQSGVKPSDMGKYMSKMREGVMGSIPEFANMLQEQQQDGEIPNPEQVQQNIQQ